MQKEIHLPHSTQAITQKTRHIGAHLLQRKKGIWGGGRVCSLLEQKYTKVDPISALSVQNVEDASVHSTECVRISFPGFADE